MKKRMIAAVGAAALTVAMQITVFAASNSNMVKTNVPAQTQVKQNGCGSMMSGRYGFMMDENGSLLGLEDFTKKLDEAVKDGTVKAEDKEYYLDMYERCARGWGSMMRGGC